MKKIFKIFLAITLIFHPIVASSIGLVHAQNPEKTEEHDENYDTESLDNVFERLLEEGLDREDEEVKELDVINEVNISNESSEDDGESESTEEELEVNSEEEQDLEDTEMENEKEENGLEDFLWQNRFLVIDEEGALVKIDETMTRSGATLIHANNGTRIPNTSFDFRNFNWVDPNNQWNLWQGSGLPKLLLRIGNQTFTVFCIEPAVPPRDGNTNYMVSLTPNGVAQTSFSSAQREFVRLILLYGYGSSFISENQRNSDDAYVATQALIWTVVANTTGALSGGVLREWNLPAGQSAMYQQLIRNNTRSSLYHQIKNDVNNHELAPSFASRSQNNAPTHTMTRNNNGVYTVTLNDSRGVLSRYFTGTNATVNDFVLQRSNNRLTINLSTENARRLNGSTFLFNGNNHAPFRKEFSGTREVSWATNPGSQDVAFGGFADPIPIFMNVSVPIRTVTVKHVRKSDGAVILTEIPRFGNNENWLDGDTVRSTPRKSITQGSTELFPIDSSEVLRTISGENVTITHYYDASRIVTIQHRLQGTTIDLVAPQTIDAPANLNTGGRWFDGMTATSRPRTDLTHEGRPVRPTDNNTNAISQTINGSNIVITHYYERSKTINVRHENARNSELVTTTNGQATSYALRTPNVWYSGERFQSATKIFTRLMPDGTTRNWRHRSSAPADGSGVVGNSDIRVIHRYDRPQQITIHYVDQETGNYITTDIENSYYDGDKVTLCPREDLVTDEGYVYITTDSCQTLTLTDKDETVTFEYVVPSLTINVDRMEITTGQSNLEATLILSRSTKHDQHLGNIRYRVKITNLETNVVTQTPERLWRDFKTTESVNLPTSGMEIGQEAKYQVEVVFTQNPSPNQLLTDSDDLETKGFKSNEKVLTIEDVEDGKVSHTAPARTVATRNENNFSVEILNEEIEFDFVNVLRQRTGYGVEVGLSPIFTSQIYDVADIDLNLNVQESLVDSFIYEQFKPQDGNITIPFEITYQQTMNQQTHYRFEFPQIFVQRAGGDTGNGGQLFTSQQVEDSHPYIQNELLDGGRRFYVPVWHDLGEYNLNYESDLFGRNLMSIDMDQTLDVFAFMYAWIGSPTVNEDMLLLQPIFPDTQTPEGWTQEQIDWLKGY